MTTRSVDSPIVWALIGADSAFSRSVFALEERDKGRSLVALKTRILSIRALATERVTTHG